MHLLRVPALLLLLPAFPLAAQVEVPLTPYLDVLRTVTVEIGGETAEFLLDTGGGATIISPALAGKLGCRPEGRATGFRMRGEKVIAPTCAGATLGVANTRITADVQVFDLMSLIGAGHAPVHGMVSLHTFAGRPVTLDLPRDRLILESPESLEHRTRSMHPLQVRLANGHSGDQLSAIVGVPTGKRTLWFLWDSGHVGPVFVAPHILPLLGIDTTVTREITLPEPLPRSTFAVRDIIYDGVLGQPLIARAAWSLDLAAGRMWVGGFAADRL